MAGSKIEEKTAQLRREPSRSVKPKSNPDLVRVGQNDDGRDENPSVTGIGHKSVTLGARCAAPHNRIVLKKNTLADYSLRLEYSLGWQSTCFGQLCLRPKDRMWKLKTTNLNFG
jgi:hypothetical protein